jgi:hypothetical protein
VTQECTHHYDGTEDTEMPRSTKPTRIDISLPKEADFDAHSTAVLKSLVVAAKKRPLTIELANKAGRPFRVISKPGGGVMWGVGGCGVGG